jgi:hypothetical protein
VFHRAFDIQSAIATVDVIDVDDDLRLAFELLLFLFHRSSPPHPSPLPIGEKEGVKGTPKSAF